jgi:hypothetical protein
VRHTCARVTVGSYNTAFLPSPHQLHLSISTWAVYIPRQLMFSQTTLARRTSLRTVSEASVTVHTLLNVVTLKMLHTCKLCVWCSNKGRHLHPEMVPALPSQVGGEKTVQLEDIPVHGVCRRAGPAKGQHTLTVMMLCVGYLLLYMVCIG